MVVEPRAQSPLPTAGSSQHMAGVLQRLWLGCGQSQSQPGGEYEYEAAAVLQGVLQSVLPGIIQKYT